MKHLVLATLIALAGASATPSSAQQLQWELAPVRSSKPSSVPAKTIQHTSITWEILAPPSLQQQSKDDTFKVQTETQSINSKTTLTWEAVDPDAIIPINEEEINRRIFASTQDIQTAHRVRATNAPTYASSRALWRNDRWHPQISYLIPNGYGPKGIMLDASLNYTDCPIGTSQCEPLTNIFSPQNGIDNGSTYFNLGFGDTKNWGGILITNSAERISGSILADSNPINRNNILQGIQTGLHYSKAIGPDTSFRTGIENLITWDKNDSIFSDKTRNFYFVGSQRLRLKDANNSNKWFRNLYLTAGIGNGDFKPIEQTFQDQNQAIKDAGCATYGFAPKKQCSNERVQRALRTGSDYGQINPIASASLEVFDGLNMITEWSGRNLNAGLSWRPFADLGIVITPMVESIVRNCEYQECRVTPIKGYSKKVALDDNILTSRLRLSIQASIQIKF